MKPIDVRFRNGATAWVHLGSFDDFFRTRTKASDFNEFPQ
jgi:hypothetical protein